MSVKIIGLIKICIFVAVEKAITSMHIGVMLAMKQEDMRMNLKQATEIT